MKTFFLVLLLILLAGCAVPQTDPEVKGNLPPPEMETLAPGAAAEPDESLDIPPTTFPEDIAALARSQYGDRLIAYIEIPAIDVFAPVTPVGWQTDWVQGDLPGWDNPKAAVGWALTSALPGDAGNIILYGHNNIDSSVFKNLYKLQTGDAITLQTGEGDFAYATAEVKIFEARDDAEDREIFNAWLKPTRAPRLTLISCWPPDNNTHRVIVIAYPLLP